MPENNILLIEDDKSLIRILRYNFEKAGYAVTVANNGQAGLEAFRESKPDLVVLDVMMPKLDGFEFLKIVRKQSQTPILMLTARKEEVDRVLGLEMGADDYVTKPFSIRELLARIKVLLKRASGKKLELSQLRSGDLEIDFTRYETKVKGKSVQLSTKEYQFLKCLAQVEGRALTRDELLEQVWGYDQSLEIDTHTVDQHVLRLRDKLGSEASRIVTVKGVGYRLKLD
jgi:DNA-binding response OmpR family regulator